MKISHFLALTAATLLSVTNAFAATERIFNFADSPYTANTSIIGLNGWTGVVVDSDNNDDAKVIDLAHAPNGKALRIVSSSTNSLPARRRTALNNTFGTGNQVDGPLQIKISAAFDTTDTSLGSIAQIGFHATNNNTPPLLIGFAPNKGIYLALGSTSGTYPNLDNDLLIATSDMKLGSFYDFTIDVDFATRTFDLRLTGLDKDDNIITITKTGIGFQSTATTQLQAITGLRFENYRGDRITMDIAHISIIAVPEPKLNALMLIGTVGAFAFYKRRIFRKQTQA